MTQSNTAPKSQLASERQNKCAHFGTYLRIGRYDWNYVIKGQDGTVTVIYDMDIDYNVNAEVR